MRQFYVLLFLIGSISWASAQTSGHLWTPVQADQISLPETAVKDLNPTHFKTFELQYGALAHALVKAPMEFTQEAKTNPLLVELPTADGTFRTFKVWESPIMAPALAARYPMIRNFAGEAADGSGATVRLGFGYTGFHAFQFEKDGSIQSVRPFAQGQTQYYMAYKLSDLPRENALEYGVPCGVSEADATEILQEKPLKPAAVADRGNVPVDLKKYTIAIAARAEYSLFYGGNKPAVLSAINTALDFIVAIQVRDFGLRLELHPGNDSIIFLDPNTDPYTGSTVGEWMQQNQAAIDGVLDNASYDVGHVFSRYITGDQAGVVAGDGRVCNNATKAKGASSAQNTSTEYFYLVAAHEFGHQLSASHSWSNCPNAQQQIALTTAYEPGSGTTIMSYAGSCTDNNNVQNDNDSYYHLASILQAQNFMWQGAGNTCGSVMPTNNNAPTVTITSPKNVAIPISTPFKLTAAGSDADNDVLSYCWEQYDTDIGSYQLGMPQNNAPAFRSYPPVAEPTRYFPNLMDYTANMSTVAEVLPTYNRTLKFRVTVRDNNTTAGGQAWDEISITPRVAAGPFRVTFPNTAGLVWSPGEFHTVTWNVANTDQSPVNCQRVNIRMSTDGGMTYPITLATNVLNRGRYCIEVPSVTTSAARIMVEAADNVFFDISNFDIKIQAPAQPGFSLCAPAYDTVCMPEPYSLVIQTASVMGFSDPVSISVEGLPMGVTATVNPNPVQPGSDAVLTLNFPVNQPEMVLDYKVKATATSLTDSTTNTLWIYQNDFSTLAGLAPADGAVGEVRLPTLRWTTVGAAKYTVEVATNPSFAPGTIVASASGIAVDSFALGTQLEEGAIYYWRFRPTNACGIGDWVGPYVFATVVDVCTAFVSTDVPKNITANAAVTVESKITLPAGGKVSGVRVTRVQGNHSFFRELEMHLLSPAGTDVLLFKEKCGGISANFNFGFDGASPNAFSCSALNNGTLFLPEGSFSAFNGQDVGGDWILRVKDNVPGSGGVINGFDLEVCSSTAANPPVLVNNNTLQVVPGGNAAITAALLKTEDSNNSDDELVYTLLTVPANGELQLYWTGAMQPGAQFTQTDLNNGGLGYFHYGPNTGLDEFCFTVTDGEGGLVKDCFTIQPFPVATGEPGRSLLFALAPNPATETVRVAFGEALQSDARLRIFDAAGRLVQQMRLTSGQNSVTVQVADFPEGVYTVAVENKEGNGVRKLVVR